MKLYELKDWPGVWQVVMLQVAMMIMLIDAAKFKQTYAFVSTNIMDDNSTGVPIKTQSIITKLSYETGYPTHPADAKVLTKFGLESYAKYHAMAFDQETGILYFSTVEPDNSYRGGPSQFTVNIKMVDVFSNEEPGADLLLEYSFFSWNESTPELYHMITDIKLDKNLGLLLFSYSDRGPDVSTRIIAFSLVNNNFTIVWDSPEGPFFDTVFVLDTANTSVYTYFGEEFVVFDYSNPTGSIPADYMLMESMFKPPPLYWDLDIATFSAVYAVKESNFVFLLTALDYFGGEFPIGPIGLSMADQKKLIFDFSLNKTILYDEYYIWNYDYVTGNLFLKFDFGPTSPTPLPFLKGAASIPKIGRYCLGDTVDVFVPECASCVTNNNKIVNFVSVNTVDYYYYGENSNIPEAPQSYLGTIGYPVFKNILPNDGISSYDKSQPIVFDEENGYLYFGNLEPAGVNETNIFTCNLKRVDVYNNSFPAAEVVYTFDTFVWESRSLGCSINDLHLDKERNIVVIAWTPPELNQNRELGVLNLTSAIFDTIYQTDDFLGDIIGLDTAAGTLYVTRLSDLVFFSYLELSNATVPSSIVTVENFQVYTDFAVGREEDEPKIFYVDSYVLPGTSLPRDALYSKPLNSSEEKRRLYDLEFLDYLSQRSPSQYKVSLDASNRKLFLYGLHHVIQFDLNDISKEPELLWDSTLNGNPWIQEFVASQIVRFCRGYTESFGPITETKTLASTTMDPSTTLPTMTPKPTPAPTICPTCSDQDIQNVAFISYTDAQFYGESLPQQVFSYIAKVGFPGLYAPFVEFLPNLGIESFGNQQMAYDDRTGLLYFTALDQVFVDGFPKKFSCNVKVVDAKNPAFPPSELLYTISTFPVESLEKCFINQLDLDSERSLLVISWGIYPNGYSNHIGAYNLSSKVYDVLWSPPTYDLFGRMVDLNKKTGEVYVFLSSYLTKFSYLDFSNATVPKNAKVISFEIPFPPNYVIDWAGDYPVMYFIRNPLLVKRNTDTFLSYIKFNGTFQEVQSVNLNALQQQAQMYASNMAIFIDEKRRKLMLHDKKNIWQISLNDSNAVPELYYESSFFTPLVAAGNNSVYFDMLDNYCPGFIRSVVVSTTQMDTAVEPTIVTNTAISTEAKSTTSSAVNSFSTTFAVTTTSAFKVANTSSTTPALATTTAKTTEMVMQNTTAVDFTTTKQSFTTLTVNPFTTSINSTNFNGTVIISPLEVVFSEQGASDFAVTVNVITGTAIAGTVGGSIVSSVVVSSTLAGAGAGAGGVAGNAALAGQAAAGPYILIVLNQLQFMVLLNMISGDVPPFYQSFAGGISWVMLGFSGANFGTSTSPSLNKRDRIISATNSTQNGMERYAQSIGLDVSQVFSSFMIIFLLLAGAALLLVFVFSTFRRYQEKVKAAKDGNTPATFGAKVTNVGLNLSRKGFGHLFIFAYISMCTLSVAQLFIADTIGNFFGALVLAVICTGFLVMLSIAIIKPDYEWSKKFLSATEPVYNTFFKEIVCGDYKDENVFAGVVKTFFKYLVGIITGAAQNVPVAQTCLIMSIYILQAVYFLKTRPHKFNAVFWVEIVATLVSVVSLALKVYTTAYPDVQVAAVGAALLVVNGALIILVLVGIMVEQTAKFLDRRAKARKTGSETEKKDEDIAKSAELNSPDVVGLDKKDE
jgi:hypothetical protein